MTISLFHQSHFQFRWQFLAPAFRSVEDSNAGFGGEHEHRVSIRFQYLAEFGRIRDSRLLPDIHSQIEWTAL